MSPILALLMLTSETLGGGTRVTLGQIDLFGYSGIRVEGVRAALPVKPGDQVELEQMLQTRKEIESAVRAKLGKGATDVAMVCCNREGNPMMYVGIPGPRVKPPVRLAAPRGDKKVSPLAAGLYRKFEENLELAITAGRTSEDHSQGFPVSEDPALREVQLAMRDFAMKNGPHLRKVVATSSDAESRRVAAHLLGYGWRSPEQVRVLFEAARDADETVRNNAIRALGVFAAVDGKLVRDLPPAPLVAMLNSPTWTDRNKGSILVAGISSTREPKLMSALRSGALDALIEMARWTEEGHAQSARIILARLAGVPEEEVLALAQPGQLARLLDLVSRMEQ